MRNFEHLKSPTWLAPYHEYTYIDTDDTLITSLRPLLHEENGTTKIKIFRGKSSGDPFIDFCKHSEVTKIIDEISNVFALKDAPQDEQQLGLLFYPDEFIKYFNPNSPHIDDGNLYMKSTIKAINKKARQWYKAGAEYIILY